VLRGPMDYVNGLLFVSIGFLVFSAVKRLAIVCADRLLEPGWRERTPVAFLFAHRRFVILGIVIVLACVYLVWMRSVVE
jgi:hypothetical protein